MHWIDKIDLTLKKISEEQTFIYYLSDKGKKLDKEKLDKKAEEWKNILLDPILLKKTETLLEKEENPTRRRKAEILQKWIIETKIDYNKDLFRLRNEIEETVNQFNPVIEDKETTYTKRWEILRKTSERKKRKEAYYSIKPLLDSIEKKARASIKLANELARNEGFFNYPELRLSIEDLSVNYISDVFTKINKETDIIWKNYIESTTKKIDYQNIETYDLSYLINKFYSPPDEKFPKEKMLESLKLTLSSFDITLESLPIKIEFYDMPNAGACYGLKMRKDIRLIVNPKGEYGYYNVFFHEFGHAMHCAYSPQNTALLIDGHLFCEGMADIWAGLLEQREWLQKFASFSSNETDKFINNQTLINTYRRRTNIREFAFELELYKNPDADFGKVWRKTGEEYLGIEDKSNFWSYLVFIYPLYVKCNVFK